MSHGSCVFCDIVAGLRPAAIVHETDTTLAFLDQSQVNAYHTLVIPKQHYTDVFAIPLGEWVDVMAAVKHVADLYREKLSLDAVEILNCSGAAAQQAVFHLHVHIVPRHAGDGQDTHWRTHPELQQHFSSMLDRIR
ncbi:MAG: HIT domain-containing protein [Bacteroidota bacterium]